MTAIRVTEKHIAAGHKKSCSGCPVAMAISEVLEPRFKALVMMDFADIYRQGEFSSQEKLEMPRGVREFIASFDDGDPVRPMEFPLDIPARFLRANVTEGGE